MSSPKFRVALGSILIVAAPLALFLIRYLQSNPFESLFTMDAVRVIGLTAVLSVFGIIFVFLAGMVIPGMFSIGAEEKPDYSAWAIGCGVVMAMFVVFLISNPFRSGSASSPNNVDNRSMIFFKDGRCLHYDPCCPNIKHDIDELGVVYYTHENIKDCFWDYSYCIDCNNNVYLDIDELVVHSAPNCPNISEDASFEKDMLTTFIIDDRELCPYCY